MALVNQFMEKNAPTSQDAQQLWDGVHRSSENRELLIIGARMAIITTLLDAHSSPKCNTCG